MIKTLKIGTRIFDSNLIQGPLAGISCAPFRALTANFSDPAFSYTEMMSCKTILHQSKSSERFLYKDPAEGPVCFQLSGTDPKELGEATKIVTDCGADLIDLNCGCPVDKIRSRGAGSKLLASPLIISELISAMKQNTHLPVSIKIRVDGHSSDQHNRALIEVIKDSGLDFLVVHGRHWTESYDVPCHDEDIQFFVEQLSIPVIGNGDVACTHSLQKMFKTGCAGVMISRASVGQPWLFSKLRTEMAQQRYKIPSNPVVGSFLITHVEKLAQLLNNEKLAIIQSRKFAKYYARHLFYQTEFAKAMNQCESLENLKSICSYYFECSSF